MLQLGEPYFRVVFSRTTDFLFICSDRISAHSVNTNVLFRSTVEIYNLDLTIPWISLSGSFGSINSFLWQLSWITWHHFGYIKVRINEKLRNKTGVERRLDQYSTVMVGFSRSSLALSCLWKINDVAKPESHQLFKCWISKKYPGGQSLVVSPFYTAHIIRTIPYGFMSNGPYEIDRWPIWYGKKWPWSLPSLLLTIFASSARPPNNRLWFLLS